MIACAEYNLGSEWVMLWMWKWGKGASDIVCRFSKEKKKKKYKIKFERCYINVFELQRKLELCTMYLSVPLSIYTFPTIPTNPRKITKINKNRPCNKPKQ